MSTVLFIGELIVIILDTVTGEGQSYTIEEWKLWRLHVQTGYYHS